MINNAKLWSPFWRNHLLENMVDEGIDKHYKSNDCMKPATNIIEKEKSFLIELLVPGINKEDVKIDLNKDILNISYSEKDEKKEEKNNYTRREFFKGNFCRSFTVPDSIEIDKIDAKYENGILSVTLPKKVEAMIKKEYKVA